MESVIIVAPHPYDDVFKRRLELRWIVSESSSKGLVVEERGNRVYVTRDDAVGDELESAVRNRIESSIPAPVFYTVDFSDLDLCRRVLVGLADDANLLVDNDHGVLLPGPEFVRVLRSQHDWDWRRDPP